MRHFLFLPLAVALIAAPAAAMRAPADVATVKAEAPNDSSFVRPSHVISISAAPSYSRVTVPSIKSDSSVSASRIGLVLLLPFAFAGVVKSITADNDTYFSGRSVRDQLNQVIRDFYYFSQNGLLSTTVATQPVCATATVTSKVKTTNATVLRENGLAVALAATDNFWILTGGDLAIGSFRRYLLLDTAGVASVQASTDAATAAACKFNTRPAAGTSIVGILTVATDATHTFTPAVTLLGAAGITATYIDGVDDSVYLSAIVTNQ